MQGGHWSGGGGAGRGGGDTSFIFFDSENDIFSTSGKVLASDQIATPKLLYNKTLYLCN